MRTYIQARDTQAWAEPLDWIDINTVADNEILLLVTEGSGVGFTVKVGTGTGTFSIDWGDGTVQTGLTGNGTTVFGHQHTTGGTPCSGGYDVWKVRIYGASGNITGWKTARHTYKTGTQACPILSVNIGAANITDLSYALNIDTSVVYPLLKKIKIASFAACTTAFAFCANRTGLRSVTLPASWEALTNIGDMFGGCTALEHVTLPASWGYVTNASQLFQDCANLKDITLPTSWGAMTSISNMFLGCKSLRSVTLPASWGGITYASMMFTGCEGLTSITLPAAFGAAMDTANSMFSQNNNLKTITNLNYLGSNTVQCNMASVLYNSTFVQQAVVIGSLLSSVGVKGWSGTVSPITSIRLTNAGSLFEGAAYQVDVSYTSLNAAAINLLFGDLPTLVGKTINITGCPGAATCTRSIATAKGWTVTG